MRRQCNTVAAIQLTELQSTVSQPLYYTVEELVFKS